MPSTHATRAGLRSRAVARVRAASRGLQAFAPAVDLVVRLFVASVFFKSGLTKIASWSSTLSLFENEYAVPLLPPEAAALLGTGVALFFFNIVAVVSYPDLGAVGLKDHQTWGLLLLVTLLHGPGKLSLDHLLGT